MLNYKNKRHSFWPHSINWVQHAPKLFLLKAQHKTCAHLCGTKVSNSNFKNSHIVLTYSTHKTHDVCLNVLAHCLTYTPTEVYCSVIQEWCFLHTPNGVTEESLGSITHDSPSPHFNPNLFPGLFRPFLLLPPAFFDAQRTQLGSSTRDEPVITKKRSTIHTSD